jgi:hypothetical protein
VSLTGLLKAKIQVLIEDDSEVGASLLVWKMLLGRVEVPKVLRGCTGVQGSPVLCVALRPKD